MANTPPRAMPTTRKVEIVFPVTDAPPQFLLMTTATISAMTNAETSLGLNLSLIFPPDYVRAERGLRSTDQRWMAMHAPERRTAMCCDELSASEM